MHENIELDISNADEWVERIGTILTKIVKII